MYTCMQLWSQIKRSIDLSYIIQIVLIKKMQGILVYSRSSISLHIKGLLIGLRTVPLCKIRGIEVLKKKMTAYMYLKILVRLHQFESLNLFKILQINNIFSYPSVWNGFWGIVIHFNINFVFFSILFILI